MMEWLLNIQQAVKSMQGVVGRLYYGGTSVLFFFLFSFHGFWTVSCLLPQSFNCHSFTFPADSSSFPPVSALIFAAFLTLHIASSFIPISAHPY